MIMAKQGFPVSQLSYLSCSRTQWLTVGLHGGHMNLMGWVKLIQPEDGQPMNRGEMTLKNRAFCASGKLT